MVHHLTILQVFLLLKGSFSSIIFLIAKGECQHFFSILEKYVPFSFQFFCLLFFPPKRLILQVSLSQILHFSYDFHLLSYRTWFLVCLLRIQVTILSIFKFFQPFFDIIHLQFLLLDVIFFQHFFLFVISHIIASIKEIFISFRAWNHSLYWQYT